MHYENLLEEAIKEAEAGLLEGGLPIGAVLVDGQGDVIARGHNQRVQQGDPTGHAEMICFRHAGRRRDWHKLTLVTTLSPCIMCTGAALLYKVPRIIIGENINFLGAEDLLRDQAVELVVLQNKRCVNLMAEFIAARKDLWEEDIGD
jgi:cytosine deaminase